MLQSIIHTETREGTPIPVGRLRLIPLARTVRLQLGRLPLGLIWNRPLAVKVCTPDGRSQVLPVQDVTRRTQLMLLGVGLIGSLLIWLARPRRA